MDKRESLLSSSSFFSKNPPFTFKLVFDLVRVKLTVDSDVVDGHCQPM
jgi:hypothetical protein